MLSHVRRSGRPHLLATQLRTAIDRCPDSTKRWTVSVLPSMQYPVLDDDSCSSEADPLVGTSRDDTIFGTTAHDIQQCCFVSKYCTVPIRLPTCAQPLWSAYRASAYGSGLLTIHDADTATWQWNGFVRNNVNTAGYYDDGTEVRVSGTRHTHAWLVMLLPVATLPSMRLGPLLSADHVCPSLAPFAFSSPRAE